jgi:hypothetical protein
VDKHHYKKMIGSCGKVSPNPSATTADLMPLSAVEADFVDPGFKYAWTH